VPGSTGTLAQQIQNGAPADLFFAADESYVDDLSKQGLILPDTRLLYAQGRNRPGNGERHPQRWSAA